MPGIVQQHHHRSTTKATQKPFKPRFTSKNAQRDASKGRVERAEKGTRKTTHQQIMSKFDRRNQAKQRRLANHKDHECATSVFAGRDGAPRIVAVVPLCEDIDVDAAISSLNESVDITDTTSDSSRHITVDRFKQKLRYITPRRGLLDILDACSIADYVLCILSAGSEADDFGELILRSIEGQGISNVYTAAQHLEKVEPAKRRPQTLLSLKSYISHFFPSQEKVFSLESRQECQNIVRSLCTTTPRGITWREQRSWLCAEDVRWEPQTEEATGEQGREAEHGALVVTGVVRGQSLKADRLVHVGDWGDFQISKITAATRPQQTRKPKDSTMLVDLPEQQATLSMPTGDQDTLAELAPEEVIMDDADAEDAITSRSLALNERKSVLLDDAQYYSGEENENVANLPKRLPRGTSSYQAAWYLGDNSDSGSDMQDDEDITMEEDMPANDQSVAPPLTEGGASTIAPSEMGATSAASSDDEVDDDDLAAYRSKKSTLSRAEAARQFPDEIELPPTVDVRERLSRYRGLKSAKTSPWITAEDKPHEPEEWQRLLDIADYRAAKNKVLRDSLVGGVKAGIRVNVHVRDVPIALWQAYVKDSEGAGEHKKPLKFFSILRHEHKHTAIHSTLTISSSFPRPLENKEELIVQVGMRRFVVNSTFTAVGATPNNVHKVDRWAWPGTTVVASWVGPLTWGTVPVLCYTRKTASDSSGPEAEKQDNDTAMTGATSSEVGPQAQSDSPLQLIGTGTLLPPTTSRILAKRAILTGQPAAIHRNVTTVRYMFFNREDVAYFRSLPLWTNRGRRGQIKEALGMHGRFKAVFEGAGGKRVNVQESVKVSLWKRVWPVTARPLRET